LAGIEGKAAGQFAVGVGLGEEVSALLSNAATASAPAANRNGGSS